MTLAFLNIGTQEMILIVIAILLLFGGKKLPELARGLGRGIRDFKDASDGIKREISDQINNFEKNLDVTVEDKPKDTSVNAPVVESETSETSETTEEVAEKKYPSFSSPENTYQHNPGEHPADGSDYYTYGYNDHFATEDESPKLEDSSTVEKDIEEKPTETKQA